MEAVKQNPEAYEYVPGKYSDILVMPYEELECPPMARKPLIDNYSTQISEVRELFKVSEPSLRM